MNHISDRLQQIIFRPLLMVILLVSITGCKDQEVTGMKQIEGSVWYRERMLPPPDTEVIITLEDVSRMDAGSEIIAVTGFEPRGGPPWSFSLKYDPSKIHDKGRYALRARVKSKGRLIFTSTEHIPAFNRNTDEPLKIMVSQVSGTNPRMDSLPQKSGASLTNTYWKLTELNGESVRFGDSERELYIALLTEGNRFKGFSGCNNLTGIYNVEENHIEFLQMASTGKACIDGMGQEQSFLSALENSKRFRISGDILSLHGADGRLFLRFEAVHMK